MLFPCGTGGDDGLPSQGAEGCTVETQAWFSACVLWTFAASAYSWISRTGLTAGKILDMQKVSPLQTTLLGICRPRIYRAQQHHPLNSAAINRHLFLSFPKCRVAVSQMAWRVEPMVGAGSMEPARRETKFTVLTSDLHSRTAARWGFPSHTHIINKQTNI